MQKVTPFLWFDNNAEEAMNFYVSIFKDAEVVSLHPMGGKFKVGNQEFMTLNGGPQYKFTEAISLYIDCDDQEEVDELWEKLSEGGEKGQCGWLKDKFGLSWQIIPKRFGEIMSDPDPEKSKGVMEALLKMTKIEIKDLEQAYTQG